MEIPFYNGLIYMPVKEINPAILVYVSHSTAPAHEDCHGDVSVPGRGLEGLKAIH